MSHTPGPWTEQRWGSELEQAGGWQILGPNGERVMAASVTRDTGTFTLPNRRDIALILAAPDLLAVLKAVLHELRKCAQTLEDEWIGPEDSTDQAIDQAEAIIAKLENQP